MKPLIPLEAVSGVVAVMPTPSTEDAALPDAPFAVDLSETERATRALVEDGVGAIATNGTLGEMATLSHEEWTRFNEVVLSTAHSLNADLPVFVGVTTLSTRETIQRAREVRRMGGRGAFIGRPFWSTMDPAAILAFYTAVTEAVPDLSIMIYDNPEAFKGPLPTPVYDRLSRLPQVVAAKYMILSPKFHQDMAAVDGRMRLLPVELDWFVARTMWPDATPACWSSSAACGPEPAMALAEALTAGHTDRAHDLTRRITHTYETFLAVQDFAEFSKYNIPLEKARFDAAGFMKAGPARHPYHLAPDQYVAGAAESGRRWADLSRKLLAERASADAG